MSLYNSKQNNFFIVGALFSFLFIFFSLLPSVTAITWNVDFTTVTTNNTIHWNSHSFDYLDTTYYNRSDIDNIVTNNLSSYVSYNGATSSIDLGSHNITASHFIGDGSQLRGIISSDRYIINFNSSLFSRVIFNLTKGDVNVPRLEVQTEPGNKFIYGDVWE